MMNYFIKNRRRLHNLLKYAKEHIPYYRICLPERLDDAFTDLNAWNRMVPLLDKETIQTSWEFFLTSPDIAKSPYVTIRNTSGSSGIPLKIVRNSGEILHDAVRIWSARSHRLKNIIRKKVLTLDPFMFGEQSNIMHFTQNGYVDFSTEAFKRNAERIHSFAPDWVYGFSTGIYRFAQFMLQEKIYFPSIQLAEVTGEMLFSNQRKIIEQAFRCDVVNMYGSQEFDILSYECKNSTLHAWTHNLFFEVLKDGQPVPEGEMGELVVTSLTNYTMPFIRYRLGDLVQMKATKCRCGDTRPELTPIGGRIGSLIKTSKKTISSNAIKRLFDMFLGEHDQMIFEYQVIQTDLEKMDVLIKPGNKYHDLKDLNALVKSLYDMFPEAEFTIKIVKEITISPSGKTKRFIPFIDAFDMSHETSSMYIV
jgi:phenylacetate-CoA ligase